MKLTNLEIYNNAAMMSEAFFDANQYLPIKINFYIQKNKSTLLTLAQDIENSRVAILNNYGKKSDDGNQYVISTENIEIAQKELNDLFALEQDVHIYTIGLEQLSEDISLTTGQMEAIIFMIE